jgi:hypothetical protein
MSSPSILGTFLHGFFLRFGRRNIYGSGAAMLLLLAFLTVWGLSGRVEAQFSACTHVLTNEQVEKLTGTEVALRSAEHDEQGCSARYQAKRGQLLAVRIVRAEGSFQDKVAEEKPGRGVVVETVEELDDPAVVFLNTDSGDLRELWVSRPAAPGRLEVSFVGGVGRKTVDQDHLLKMVKGSLKQVDAYLKDGAPKPNR